MVKQNKILITGIPTSGKSTLVQKIIETYQDKQGFITREVQKDGKRFGFEVITANGTQQTLAAIGLESIIQVSKYGVDVAGFEPLLSKLKPSSPNQLLYLDEIGQMQFYAESFSELVRSYIEAPNIFIGSFSKVYTNELMQGLRKDPRVRLIDIDELGREEAFRQAQEHMAKMRPSSIRLPGHQLKP